MKTLKNLQQKIEERFDELGPIWLEDNDKGTTDQWIPRNKARFFVLSELEKALREFAETVRVDDYVPDHDAHCAINAHPELIGSCSCEEENSEKVWKFALAEQEERVKKFFE